MIQILKDNNLSESMTDWLMSVGRLSVKALVSWSCYVTTKQFPMIYREEDEMQQNLLEECHRAGEVWSILKGLSLDFNINYSSVMYRLLEEKMPTKQEELFQLIIAIVCVKLWKITCVMVLKQTIIDSDRVSKDVPWQLRTRTMDKDKILPWHLLDI